jgi:N-acyl-D-amino-acid deacylase
MRRAIHCFPLAIIIFTAACSEPQSFDLILRGGTIVDGTGDPAYVADVAVNGKHIAQIGDLASAVGAEEIDVAGLVVSPGFINIHSHATPEGLPTAINMLSQGVTTEIVKADGVVAHMNGAVDLEAQLSGLSDGGLAVNVGGMIGFNSVWGKVVGMEDVRPTAQQIDEMQALVGKAVDAGAWGISAGLEYQPGGFATTEEVIDVLKPFGGRKLVFANHERAMDDFSWIAGMTETISIGETAGLIPLITHMKLQGWEQGKAATILGRMKTASTSFPGGAVGDVYPYLAGQTSLALFLPAWSRDGGVDMTLERFRNPELRSLIIEETEENIRRRVGDPENVYLLHFESNLADIVEQRDLDSTGETVVQLLEESVEDGSNVQMIAFFGREEDLITILQHPTISVACDCGAQSPERKNVHPRNYGTFPKVLGEYVREKGVLSLESAIHKMTGLPAEIIGMEDRGLLQTGLSADLVVFDPDTIVDRATYDDRTAISEGIEYTVINGQVAWRSGDATGVQAGEVIRRALPAD